MWSQHSAYGSRVSDRLRPRVVRRVAAGSDQRRSDASRTGSRILARLARRPRRLPWRCDLGASGDGRRKASPHSAPPIPFGRREYRIACGPFPCVLSRGLHYFAAAAATSPAATRNELHRRTHPRADQPLEYRVLDRGHWSDASRSVVPLRRRCRSRRSIMGPDPVGSGRRSAPAHSKPEVGSSDAGLHGPGDDCVCDSDCAVNRGAPIVIDSCGTP